MRILFSGLLGIFETKKKENTESGIKTTPPG